MEWVRFFPAKYLIGTRGLTPEQKAVYWEVCALISEHDGPYPNDAHKIARGFEGTLARRVRRLIDELIALEKLHLTDDGKLDNGKASAELERSQVRVRSAAGAATQAGVVHNRRASERKKTRKINGHGEPAGSIDTQTDRGDVTTTNTVAARAPVNGGGGGVDLEHERVKRWRVPDDLEAELRKQRPDLIERQIRQRTRDWREYAIANGVPRDFRKSWFGWMLRTERRRRGGIWG
jgi:hypothetical protein